MKFALFAAIAGFSFLIGGAMTPAQAFLDSNALTSNGIAANALDSNALSATATRTPLGSLNGVTVETTTLPEQAR